MAARKSKLKTLLKKEKLRDKGPRPETETKFPLVVLVIVEALELMAEDPIGCGVSLTSLHRILKDEYDYGLGVDAMRKYIKMHQAELWSKYTTALEDSDV